MEMACTGFSLKLGRELDSAFAIESFTVDGFVNCEAGPTDARVEGHLIWTSIWMPRIEQELLIADHIRAIAGPH